MAIGKGTLTPKANHINCQLVITHLRDGICQGEFKVHALEWVSLVEVDEAVQAVKRYLINQVILCLSILLLGFDPAVLHSPFPPNISTTFQVTI